ncbi:MAG: protein-methionine-sulfoxide reductase catalytic subunit MsrP [Gammaproteobacteria bacterium]|nr:MAG: protein-methionine-sulfoxide reductase catalytic subunit MsrP [Gammaproteobacteria bacterium]
MLLIKRAPDIKSSEITDKELFLQRRRFLRTAAAAGAGIASPALLLPASARAGKDPSAQAAAKLNGVRKSDYKVDEKLTPYEYVTSYNNFYEFGTNKDSPAKLAKKMRTRPWTIVVEGEVNKPGAYDIDDFIKPHALEERVYRLRCVEAWSMIVPWVGFPLADVIKRFEPNSRAKYVQFFTLHDPEQMPGQRRGLFGGGLEWPYREGLRIDEAMHPLTLLVVGLYGEVLPNQNGAPLRLVVPWKYGFKSIKSIVRMRFVEKQPATTWNMAASSEYGFYSNVNPTVDHPRWSQKTERRIGEDSWFTPKRKTLMFNGYAEQVAHLYAGMDLKKNF